MYVRKQCKLEDHASLQSTVTTRWRQGDRDSLFQEPYAKCRERRYSHEFRKIPGRCRSDAGDGRTGCQHFKSSMNVSKHRFLLAPQSFFLADKFPCILKAPPGTYRKDNRRLRLRESECDTCFRNHLRFSILVFWKICIIWVSSFVSHSQSWFLIILNTQ